VPVGLSDHTLETRRVPLLAVAAGASVIEKHLTVNRNLPGPDHPFALEPEGFAAMVEAVRSVPVIMGDGVKRVMVSEDPTDRRMAFAA
jgi:N,N'-diacetyllegionaminate synthase